MDIYCLVFDDYETLDLMGPVEFLTRVPNVKLHYVSQVGGLIRSKQGFYIETEKLEHLLPHSALWVIGGQGTRQLVNDEQFINQLGKWIDESEICLSVCTGSALLACTEWEPVARWVKEGKFYTSSGVSAGMDMALGFIADYYGNDLAQDIANHTEYHWQKDPSVDNFARIHGYK